jgi:hypothetical protein
MKRKALEVRKLTTMPLGWSTRLIADGGVSTLADSGDVPQKGTEKFAQCDPSLDARLIPEVYQDLAHLPDQCFELEEVAIHSAITNSDEVHR